jgi:hypothetical protein
MNWIDIENGLRAWAMSGSGLASDRVVLADGGNRPVDDGTPYVAITISSSLQVGHDGLTIDDNPAPTPGAEIIYTARGMRQLTITFQCFGGNRTGPAAPTAALEGIVTARSLPSASDALQEAGIGVGRMSAVKWIAGVVGGSLFEPRAILEVTAFVGSERTETGTYIEHVEETPVIDGETLPSFTADSDGTVFYGRRAAGAETFTLAEDATAEIA